MKKNSSFSARDHHDELKRPHRLVCLMSEEEFRLVNRYLKKYKISNKSRWMRENLLHFIHRNMEEDYPTLFEEHEMRR
ncbi:MAG: hypothetical protein ACI4C3_05175 [Bacteroides sp.]